MILVILKYQLSVICDNNEVMTTVEKYMIQYRFKCTV